MVSTEASILVLSSVFSMLFPGLATAALPSLVGPSPPEPAGPVVEPPAGPAQPMPSPDHSLRQGLRLSVGTGIGNLHVTYYDNTIAGSTVPLDVTVGLSASSNLVVYSELYQVAVLSLVANEGSVSSIDLHGFGAGLKYDFVPAGIFVSGSLLFCQLSKSGRFDDTPSYWGPGARLSLGKRWSLSPIWSIALVGETVLARMRNNPSAARPEDEYEYNAKGFSLLVSAGLSYPPAASAKPKSLSSVGYRTHDGFYLGALLGVGWLGTKSGDLSLSGMGVPFGISAGFVPRSDVVLFAELYKTTGSDSNPSDYLVELDFFGFGPGLKYYLMPINVFLSTSLLFSELRLHDRYPGDYRARQDINQSSDWGMTGHLSAGKEWWVSADWGLGFAIDLLLGRMGGHASSYAVKGLSLLLSFSFN